MSTELKTDTPAIAFPSGDSRPIAVLADEPPALTKRFGLRFYDGLDDLDRFRYAVVDLTDQRQAVLYRYVGDPNPGTVVRIDGNVDPVTARQELTDRLSLSADDILWWSPEA
jgi:hypothetical protein